MMPTLKRALGLPALTFFGIGQILGAGIYSVIGAAAGEAGEALWLSFVAAAAVAFLSGLAYAELATAFPEAGAEFVYIRAALPARPWAATGTGLVIVVAGVATAATVSLAFDGYLRAFVALPPGLSAAALLVGATALNLAGIRESTWANILFTLVEIGGLVLVSVVGMGVPAFGDALLARPDAGVFAGAALVFFAYLGFEDIANLAEESRRPKRDLPRAIFLSLTITTVLYVLVGLTVVALAPAEDLAASSSPMVTALGLGRPHAGRLLGAIALFATANTALITLIVTSRMLFGMARAGDLPAPLRRLTRRESPWVAALAALGLAALLLPFGRVAFVGGLSSLGALTGFTVVNLAVILLRYRQPHRARPFTIPGRIGRLPILPLAGALAAAGLATQFSSDVYLAAAALATTLLLIGVIRRLTRTSR
jgi:amino acid transporter